MLRNPNGQQPPDVSGRWRDTQNNLDIMTKMNLSYRIGTINDIDQLQELRIVAYGQFQNALTADNWEIFNGNIQDKQ